MIAPSSRLVFAALVAVSLPAILLGAGCRASTQITVAVTTDVPCDHFGGAAITVGALGVIDGTSAASTTTTCVDGKVGALVIIPSGANDEAVAFRVVAGVDEPFDDCLAETPGPKCIVARRSLHFLPHTSLKVPVSLNLVCEGVPCSPDSTCVNHACVAAAIDPSTCTGDNGCALGGPPINDAGTDATVSDAGDAGADASDAAVSSDGSIALATVPGCVMGGLQPGSPWPMEGYCPSHRHRSPLRGPKTTAPLAWRIALNGFVGIQPVIAADGTVYVVTDANAVYALNPDGGAKWTATFPVGTNGGLKSTPAIGTDGTLYTNDNGGAFYRFDPNDGGMTTVPNVFNGSRTAMTIGPDGTLYIGDTSETIYALTPQGKVRWATNTSSGVDPQSPSLAADGLLYIQTADFLLTLAPGDGGIVSKLGYDGGLGIETPQIAPDGMIVVGVDKGIRGIRPGSPLTEVWSHPGNGTQVAYSVGDDGTSYFSTDNDNLTAIAADGGVTATYSNAACGQPLIDADGWLYLVCGSTDLVALDPQLKEQWTTSFASAGSASAITFDSPVIGLDGHLYLTVWNQGNGPDTILSFAAP